MHRCYTNTAIIKNLTASSSSLRKLLSRRQASTYAWGNADHGQLGLPNSNLQSESETFGRLSPTPQEIIELHGESLTHVSTSSSHSAFIRSSDDSLLTCGYNAQGQLGTGDTKSRSLLTLINNLPSLSKVACGGRHTLVLSKDGLVFSFGCNSSGQLGLGHLVSKEKIVMSEQPQLVRRLAEDGHRMIDIAAGDDFSVCLSDTGKVFTWGASHYGALGHSQPENKLSFIKFITPSSRNEHYDENPRIIRKLSDRKIETITSGRRHVLASEKEGRTMYAWGNGRHFILGTENEEDVYEPVRTFLSLSSGVGVEKVSCGNSHALILDKIGNVYSVGENDHGCLGLGERKAFFSFTSSPVLINDASPALDIAAGWNFSAVILKNGSVKTWGCADAGALGKQDALGDVWEPSDIGLKAGRIFTSSGATCVIATR